MPPGFQIPGREVCDSHSSDTAGLTAGPGLPGLVLHLPLGKMATAPGARVTRHPRH